MPIGVGLRGLTFLLTEYAVALTTGASTAAVVFPEAFSSIPVVLVIPPEGAAGTWAVSSITTTGFSWAITGTSLGNVTIGVGIAAHSKL